MGPDLISNGAATHRHAIPPWLDPETCALVIDVIETLARAYPDLLALILYGSIARHEERPVDDEYPSDVDLLAVFDSDDTHLLVHRGHAFASVLGDAFMRHLDAPREVQVMMASRTLAEWDPTYVANVAHDGIVLFARGPLPEALRRR